MSPEQKPVIDAILVHSYGYNEPHFPTTKIYSVDEFTGMTEEILSTDATPMQPTYRPNKRERWTQRSLEELLILYDIKNIVFTGGHTYDTNRPQLGPLDAQEAERKLHLSERGINVISLTEKEEANGERSLIKDTSGEVIAFLQEAKKKGWEKLASLGTFTHSFSIKQLYRRRNQPAVVFSTEKILRESKNAEKYKIIWKMHFSKEEFYFVGREIIKNILYLFPRGEEFLRKKAENER